MFFQSFFPCTRVTKLKQKVTGIRFQKDLYFLAKLFWFNGTGNF